MHISNCLASSPVAPALDGKEQLHVAREVWSGHSCQQHLSCNICAQLPSFCANTQLMLCPWFLHIALYVFTDVVSLVLYTAPHLTPGMISAGASRLYSNFLPRPGPKRGADQPVGPVAYEPYGRR